MEHQVTPQPHFVPGYTGHCPQFRFREGKTYGHLTHKLLVDPCTNHAPELIVTPTNLEPVPKDAPTPEEIETLQTRQQHVEALYRHPMLPGYDGFVPNMPNKIGKAYVAAATAGVAEHEQLMNELRCQRRFLEHGDLLASGRGVFSHKLCERLIPTRTYRAPLLPVKKRAQAVELLDCSFQEKKEPYSKNTVPHFMEDDDEEKYVISGYAGHLPMSAIKFGQSSKELTNQALCDFSRNSRHRRHDRWCPMDPPDRNAMCPNRGHFIIYHKEVGMVPSYAGHVPGEIFQFGRTYGFMTVDAKKWLTATRELEY